MFGDANFSQASCVPRVGTSFMPKPPDTLFHFHAGAIHPLRRKFLKHFNAGQLDLAMEAAEAADAWVKENGDSEALSAFAVASMKGATVAAQGDLDAAWQHFDGSAKIAASPEQEATVDLNLGTVRLRQNRLEEAREFFERGLSRTSRPDALFANLLITLQRLGASEKVDQLLEWLSCNLDVTPSSPLGILLRHDSELGEVRELDSYRKFIDGQQTGPQKRQ
jgi:tetratricopeptide (TPR) repeat protein